MATKEQILDFIEKQAGLEEDGKYGFWHGAPKLEKKIATSYGKETPKRGLFGYMKNNQEDANIMNKGYATSLGKGFVAGGAISGGAVGGLAALLNKHPAVKKKIPAKAYALTAGLAGGYVTGLVNGGRKQMSNMTNVADKYHKMYGPKSD